MLFDIILFKRYVFFFSLIEKIHTLYVKVSKVFHCIFPSILFPFKVILKFKGLKYVADAF